MVLANGGYNRLYYPIMETPNKRYARECLMLSINDRYKAIALVLVPPQYSPDVAARSVKSRFRLPF